MRRITLDEWKEGASPYPGPCEIVNADGEVIAWTSAPIEPELLEDDEFGPLDFSNLGPPLYYDGSWLE